VPLHASELRHRHQDVDDLRGLDIRGRLAEDRFDVDLPLLEILLELRAFDADVVRFVEGVHPLVERTDRSVRLRLSGTHGRGRAYQPPGSHQVLTFASVSGLFARPIASSGKATPTSAQAATSSARTRVGASGSEK